EHLRSRVKARFLPRAFRVRRCVEWALVTAADFHPRASRFPMRLPLRYRTGESEWLNATTVNISASGVLFVVDHLLEQGTPIEMSLMMPREILGSRSSRVMCHGSIVRTVPIAEGGRLAMAATITHYRFTRSNSSSVLHLISSEGFYGAENMLVLLG